MSKIDYDAVQKAIRLIDLDDEFPFEMVTLRINKSGMDFLRLTHDDTKDIQYQLELILANGIGELTCVMKGNPDHFMYHLASEAE